MSLLHEIQDGATEDSVSLGALLRKVKLLAGRIGVKEIGEWATRELSGYENVEELPPYRGPFKATVLGDAIGPYGSGLKNFPVPSLALNEEYRDGYLFKLHFLQGVVELESLAAAKQTLRSPWPADTVMMLPMLAKGSVVKMDPLMTWVEIWKVIPYPVVVGVLDDIRTRLLDLMMQIGEEEPLAEREQRITDPERVKRATNVFHNTIYASSANIAIGNRDVTQIQEFPAPFDTDGLMDYLRNLGLDDELIDDLQDALDEDAEEGDKAKGPGRKALTWLKNVTLGATTKVGTPVASSLITQALLHHFKL